MEQAKYAIECLERISETIASGDLEVALKYSKSFLGRLATMDLAEKPRILGNLFSLMGTTYLELNRLTLAVIHHRKDLDIAERYGFADAVSRALQNLGLTYERMGDYLQAIHAWERRLADITAAAEQCKLWDDIGRCHFQLGNYDTAIEFCTKAFQTAKECHDHERMLSSQFTLGHAFCRKREFAAAVPYFEGYLELSRSVKDAEAEANALTDLGNVFLELGDVAKSIAYQQQAMALSTRL